MSMWHPFRSRRPLVAVVRLQGMIAATSRGTLSDQALAPILTRAFRRGRPSAVALAINSPGGSPVQSSLIAARIRELSEEHSVPVHAFVEDVAASGGYWLACAADEIWADSTSILGSIGVIFANFGASEFIARHGIERRLYTAGERKSLMDPFLPRKPEDEERLRRVLHQMHAEFIAHVRSRRGSRLKGGEEIFSGDVWIGREAVEKGLADGIGHLVPVMKKKFGKKVRFRTYGVRRPWLSRLGVALGGDLLAGVEERAAYSRFGL